MYASSLSVFQSYDCTVFIISQLLCVLNVYLYIIIRKKNVFAGSLPKTSKTYLRRLRKTSLRRLTDVFARLLQDIFRKTSCNYVLKTSRKRKKMLYWRHLQYVFTKTNVCWEYKTNTFFFNKIILFLWKYNFFFW